MVLSLFETYIKWQKSGTVLGCYQITNIIYKYTALQGHCFFDTRTPLMLLSYN